MYGEIVGEYNVDLYEDLVLDHKTGAEYYAVIITKFDHDDKEIGHKQFYIIKGRNLKKIKEQLKDKTTLEKMYACPEFRKFRYTEVNVTKSVKEGKLV